MLTEQFYDILDKELTAIVAENQQWIAERKLNQINQQKSYALLIWFLQFYAPRTVRFRESITDGLDDNSCDIIFSTHNGEEVFYIVQAKWNQKPKIIEGKQSPQIDANEVKKAIVDFESILQNDKSFGKNELFNKKLAELQTHLKKDSGKVKFIFLGLLSHNELLTEYIQNFEKQYASNIKFEIIDIDRLKRDFIEFRYKGIKTKNPLQYQYYQPEQDKITIPIERISDALGKGDHIKMDRPYEAYIFTLKPKTVYELFEKYEFSLFFGNIRNPLPASNYNAAIVQTLRNEPDMFWYYNNGITAISNLIYPFGVHSEQISVLGLQIINGAQTIYSIYSAYKEANQAEREIIDAEARVSFRIIKSANKDMNLQITRYTNAQNPVEARDFWANDAVQIRLQEESFQTKYWYEKRRGEFRNVPKGVVVLENGELGRLYLQFWLQKEIPRFSEELLFTSNQNDINGLYETAFHDKNISFEAMLSAYLLKEVCIKYVHSLFDLDDFYPFYTEENRFQLLKGVIEKYIKLKYTNEANINKMIRKLYEQKQEIIIKLLVFIENQLSILLKDDMDYSFIKEALEFMSFSTEDIEKIDISAYYNASA